MVERLYTFTVGKDGVVCAIEQGGERVASYSTSYLDAVGLEDFCQQVFYDKYTFSNHYFNKARIVVWGWNDDTELIRAAGGIELRFVHESDGEGVPNPPVEFVIQEP